MQINYYTDNSFVIHKITGDFIGRVSAYFSKAGELVSAEQIFPTNMERNVKVGGPIWEEVKKLGNEFKK